MHISLNHGSGGKITHRLITDLFLKYFNNEILSLLTDSAILPTNDQQLAFTTDSYVIDPIFFPGGNIGKLAVCGTINDLSVSGARPQYISVAMIIEEGFSLEDLEVIVKSMAEEAQKASVKIVTGDTKVVPRGKADKLFITTTGIGWLDKKFINISLGKEIKPGDKIIVNGNMGDHAIAILASRESLRFETPVQSDCAALNFLIQHTLSICPDIRFMRDITRGGLATVVNELAEKTGLGITIDEKSIPVDESTLGICEIFGFDPLFLANEGKVLIVVPQEKAQKVVEELKKYPEGKNAAIIGEIVEDHPAQVILNTSTGGRRLLEMPAGIQLPRIC